MSKTKAIKIPTDVQRAEQAYLQARKVKLELLAALEAAKSEEQQLESAMHQARLKADLSGPCGTIDQHIQAVFGRSAAKVVIVRRTASAVWTRPIGSAADREPQQWRKSKTSGAWLEYPATRYYRSHVLTIDGEQA